VAKKLQDQQDRVARLRADLAQEGRRQSEERDTKFEEQVKAELRAAAQEAEVLERQVQGQFPRYAGLVARSVVGGDELAKLLKPDEALIAMLVAPATTDVVVIRAQSAAGHRVAVPNADLVELVARIRASTDWSEQQGKPFDLDAARQLYKLLIAPLEPALDGVQRLVVVPAGPLQSLPFGLLAAGGDAWLAKRFAIANAPSLSAFRDLRQARATKPAAQPFIGFGDPDFAGKQANLRKVTASCRRGQIDLAELRDLPRLAESADEVKRIAASLKAAPESVMLGPKATEAAVKGAKLADYRVVMFATHGLLPTELSCLPEPALALTPPKGASGRDDGLLRASEVVNLRLNADFVVLSACNTASADGKLSGEALSGLARAFFYAGARAALVSHWAVASEPTVALTTATFAAYAKEPNAGRAAALQKAQLAMLANPATAHPVFWAPFVLVGDGS
jgi:CHAT domain-containing protein